MVLEAVSFLNPRSYFFTHTPYDYDFFIVPVVKLDDMDIRIPHDV